MVKLVSQSLSKHPVEVRTPVLRQFQNVEYTGRLRGLQPHPPPPAPPHPLHFSSTMPPTHCLSAVPCPPPTAFQQSHAPQSCYLHSVVWTRNWASFARPSFALSLALLSHCTAILSPGPLHLLFPFLPSPQLSFQPCPSFSFSWTPANSSPLLGSIKKKKKKHSGIVLSHKKDKFWNLL